jgi:predicted dehydrogenase
MSGKEQDLGFAIVGAGMIAPFHANSIRDARGGKLIVVCDVDRTRAEKLAGDYGADACMALDEMLRDPRIDVVNIVTPNHLHHDAVVACARAGKHVLTEKPPAMSLKETDSMVAACDAAGVKFGCTVQCRVRGAIQAMKHAVAKGRFGKLLHADAIMKWYRAPEYYRRDPWRSSRSSGAGVTVQHAFHYIDLLQYLAGPVAAVEARMSNLSHPSVRLEDTLIAFVRYANGAQGVVHASTALWPGTDVRIEINGENGTAIMVGEKIATWSFRDEGPEDAAVRRIGDSSKGTAAGGPTDFSYADHRTVIQDMIDAIREDREPVIPTRSVRPTVEFALAMYQSAARNTPVTLPIQDDPGIWEA